MSRPIPRPAFLSGQRQLQVTFVTSSVDKFLQARLVFSRYGLTLRHSEHADRPYREDYSGSKEELLAKAIDEIRSRTGAAGGLFFVEDTSIRIEALSGDDDVPGLAAKEWFAGATFQGLDEQLRARGSDRRATVSSCIALYVPGVTHIDYFYGETLGRVADTPPAFEEDRQYSWLSPHNFNGWFLPDGADRRRLGEMSFEASLEFDFRVRALVRLVDRLEQLAVVLNPPTRLYQRRPPTPVRPHQPPLFETGRRIILVVGPTCSGKTTFGDRATSVMESRVIDASSIVRMILEDQESQGGDTGKLARELLEIEGYDVVARRIISLIGDEAASPIVIVTGFRAIQELETFRDTYRDVTVVALESSQRVRYERYLRRGTRGTLDTFEDFRRHDAAQFELGLLRVAAELADIKIANHRSLEDYLDQVDCVLGVTSLRVPGVSRVRHTHDLERRQLIRCLEVLRDTGRPLTTQEVSAHLPAGRWLRFNNANKILKRYPALAQRLETQGSNVRYSLTAAGLAYLRAMERLSSAEGGK